MGSTQTTDSIYDLHTGPRSDSIQAFTFFINDTLYALDINDVLSLSGDLTSIQNMPVQSPGLLGVTKYQGNVVPVLDFAKRLGTRSGQETRQELITNLLAREQDHVDWLNALEDTITNGTPFTRALDPHQCAFGKWYDRYETRDETLSDILAQFDEPHKRIHSLADRLIGMRDRGQQEQATGILNMERLATLRKLRSLFSMARNQIESLMRPILLYVTRDGQTPLYALKVDEINDVIDYDAECFRDRSAIGLNGLDSSDRIIRGMLVRESGPDSILFDVGEVLREK